MSLPEPPPSHASDARRPFARADVYERLARQLELNERSRVLEVGAGESSAALQLARTLGCDAVALCSAASTVESLRADAKKAAPEGPFEVREAPLTRLGLGDNEFDAIIVSERFLVPFGTVVKMLRPHLVERGRLCLTYPVKVGRFPLPPAVELWEKRLGEPLTYPRDLLQLLTEAGLEAKWAETMSDLELDDLYRAAEGKAEAKKLAPPEEAAALSEEIAMHRSQSGRASVTFVWVMGRRRESGEKLPASRDRG